MCWWGLLHFFNMTAYGWDFFLTGTPERFSEGFNSRREVSLKGITQNFNFWRMKTSRINRVRVGRPQQHAPTLPLPYLPIGAYTPPPSLRVHSLVWIQGKFWQSQLCGIRTFLWCWRLRHQNFPKESLLIRMQLWEDWVGFPVEAFQPWSCSLFLGPLFLIAAPPPKFPWTHTSEPPPKLLHPRHDYSYTLFTLLRGTIILIYYLHYYV